MSPRPAVDVVVPFAGPRRSVEGVVRAMSTLELLPGDTVTIVDNRGVGAAEAGPVRVVEAAARHSSYYARNYGARLGSSEWIVFLDADVVPDRHLLDSYLAEPPGVDVAVLGGEIQDEPVGPGAPLAARFATLMGTMSQANTLNRGTLAYTQTANCAIRRRAFEQVGGFQEDIRSGGDADICFRLCNAGWRIEARTGARVVHANRTKLAQLVRQRARMGAGAAWLNHHHPGSFPPRRLPGLAAWTAASLTRAGRSALAGRRDDAILGTIDPLTVWAFELGRKLPNRAPGG